MKKYRVIGLMSGTSLDGVDIALCEFEKKNEVWKSKICSAQTFSYTDMWKEKLKNAHELTGYELIKLDFEYGHYLGQLVHRFLKNDKNNVDFISSHGHTIFHNPVEGISYQLGNGAAIAASSTHTTVSNFRILDVALKGQGAPLVPIGDMQLFADYDYCLNLGGFANVSYTWYKKRIAYDICPVNFIINYLVKDLHIEFDKDGIEGRKGKVNESLFKSLNKLAYYAQNHPKSLGREWVELNFLPVLNKSTISAHDKLRSVYEHIAFQVSRALTGSTSKKLLITGGGTHNKFLIELIKKHTALKVTIPEAEIIDYKEALVFAFLGVLRMRDEYNCLSSVTGSKHDNIGGAIFKI